MGIVQNSVQGGLGFQGWVRGQDQDRRLQSHKGGGLTQGRGLEQKVYVQGRIVPRGGQGRIGQGPKVGYDRIGAWDRVGVQGRVGQDRGLGQGRIEQGFRVGQDSGLGQGRIEQGFRVGQDRIGVQGGVGQGRGLGWGRIGQGFRVGQDRIGVQDRVGQGQLQVSGVGQ